MEMFASFCVVIYSISGPSSFHKGFHEHFHKGLPQGVHECAQDIGSDLVFRGSPWIMSLEIPWIAATGEHPVSLH